MNKMQCDRSTNDIFWFFVGIFNFRCGRCRRLLRNRFLTFKNGKTKKRKEEEEEGDEEKRKLIS